MAECNSVFTAIGCIKLTTIVPVATDTITSAHAKIQLVM